MQIKIDSLKREMDLRVESLIGQIHKYRDEYVEKFKYFKVEFEKWGSNLFFLNDLFSVKIETKKCFWFVTSNRYIPFLAIKILIFTILIV